MKNATLSLLAAAAIGAISIGSASAMPASNLAGLGDSQLQDVRVVCDRLGQCWNTNRRAHRSSQRYYAPQYDNGYYGNGYNSYGYYGGPGYGGYNRPGVGIGVGPFGFGLY